MLLPYSAALEAELDAVKAGLRDSVDAYARAVTRIETARVDYERALLAAGGGALVRSEITDAQGGARVGDVPAGEWLVLAWREGGHTAKRFKLRDQDAKRYPARAVQRDLFPGHLLADARGREAGGDGRDRHERPQYLDDRSPAGSRVSRGAASPRQRKRLPETALGRHRGRVAPHASSALLLFFLLVSFLSIFLSVFLSIFFFSAFFLSDFFSPFLSIISPFFSSFGAGAWAKVCGTARPTPSAKAMLTTRATSLLMCVSPPFDRIDIKKAFLQGGLR